MEARVAEIVARLRRREPASPDVKAWLPAALHEAIGGHGAVVSTIEIQGDRPRLQTCHRAGGAVSSQRTLARANAYLAACPLRRWGAFDPYVPEAGQRDRVVVMPAPSHIVATGRGLLAEQDPARSRPAIEAAIEAYYRALDWDRPVARVLICDGPRLLAYVGVTGDGPFARRQVAVLRALVPAIRERMLFDERFASAGALASALEAALELLPAAAFCLSGKRVLAANRLAVAWLRRDRDAPTTALFGAARPDPRVFTVIEVARGQTIAVQRANGERATAGARLAAASWRLTPREAEVLSWLVRGHTNARIAAELGCSAKTIEFHLTRILAKACVDSRSELIVAVLGMT